MQAKKKVIIWGMGITGQACAKYLSNQGHTLILVDKKNITELAKSLNLKNYECVLEEKVTFTYILQCELDFILVSPGIDRRTTLWQQIAQQGIKVIGDIELVFEKTKKPIIAVTGTNGKSTTVNMIKYALELADLKVFLGGNWGIPAVDVLDPKLASEVDWIILETSSFQLELTNKFCPEIAVITNVSMSHAERYVDFESYLQAKLNIFLHECEKDTTVILPKIQNLVFFPHVQGINKKVIFFDKADLQYFDFAKSKLLGTHNRENFAVAYQVLKAVGVNNLDSVIQKLIDQFPGIAHRLEKVATYKDIVFYNDSKSTNIVSTKTALASFDQFLPSYSLILFLGGKLRDANTSFLQELSKYPKITQIIAYGDAANAVEKELKKIFKVYKFETLDLGLKHVGEYIRANSQQKLVVLFSPSFPSFDQFKNFEHRGSVFKEQVQELLKVLP